MGELGISPTERAKGGEKNKLQNPPWKAIPKESLKFTKKPMERNTKENPWVGWLMCLTPPGRWLGRQGKPCPRVNRMGELGTSSTESGKEVEGENDFQY